MQLTIKDVKKYFEINGGNYDYYKKVFIYFLIM